jgi:type II secretory pathway pseudopilin PulG
MKEKLELAHSGTRHFFNLIEVVLALVVVSIGLMSIIVLFPIASNASRDSMGYTQAADTGDFILSYLSHRCRSDWPTYLDGLPNAPTDISALELALPPSGSGATEWALINMHNDFKNEGSKLYENTSTTSLRRIIQTKPDGASTYDVTDFDGVVRMWKSKTYGFYYDSGSSAWVQGENENDSQINVEISWPGSLKYESRKNIRMSLEVSKP